MKIIIKGIKSREGVVAILILVIAFGITMVNPSFIEWSNIKDILMNVSYITIASLGMSMIIITGGIDCSSGAVLALLSLCCGQLAKMGLPLPIYFVVVVLLGALTGFVNGFIIVRLHVPPMICTLALYNIYRGAILLVTGGEWITNLPKSFNIIGKGDLLGIPNSVVIMLVVIAWAVWFMERTEPGRNIYAVGSNVSAARLAGIRVERTLIQTYMISGALLAIASIVFCTRFTTIQTNVGENLHLTLIAAAVIGGISILGGSGKLIGTFLGAMVLTIIRTALVYLKISTYWDQALQGALILIAILVGMYNLHRASKIVRGGVSK